MKKKRIGLGAVIIAFVLCFGRIIYVNAGYVKPARTVYRIGQECIYKDFSYKVTGRTVYDTAGEITETTYQDVSDTAEREYQTKYVVIGLSVTYVGEQEKGEFSISGLNVQSGPWSNGLSNFYDLMRDDRELVRGEPKMFYMISTLSSASIAKSSWNGLKDRKYELVLSAYPEIIIMECQ